LTRAPHLAYKRAAVGIRGGMWWSVRKWGLRVVG
jgi:hypothetical protein